MDILLWRHAEAEDHAVGLNDLDRQLTSKGHRQAESMARWLRRNGPQAPRILVSPAHRTQQTIQPLGLTWQTVAEIAPEASVANVLKAAGWAERTRCEDSVLIVGHQPTLGRVAAYLLTGKEAPWAIKKGALWWLSHRVRAGHGETILKCVLPAELA